MAIEGTDAQMIYSSLNTKENIVPEMEGTLYFKSARELECEKFVHKNVTIGVLYTCNIYLDQNGIKAQ